MMLQRPQKQVRRRSLRRNRRRRKRRRRRLKKKEKMVRRVQWTTMHWIMKLWMELVQTRMKIGSLKMVHLVLW
jgi:hypothetical protein